MLLSDFPREVIEQITERLSFKDKKACTLVCESWKEIFEESLYFNLMLNRYELNDIVDPPQDDPPPCLKTRFIVRNLIIHPNTYVKDEDLYVLQQTFPNIKYLFMGENSMTADNFGVTADWNIWSLLTELYITVDQTSDEIKNVFMKMILCLPLLRRLQIITKRKENIQASFSLDDFETIHSHLKHLEYLELCTLLSTLSETDIERMKNVSPATKMRTMKVYSKDTDHRWLCYFARKYPNLHTLNLRTLRLQPKIDKKRSDTIALFKQVPFPFQHLTTLDFYYRNYDGNEFILFWDILHFHDIPLKHLSINMEVSVEVPSAIDFCDIIKNFTDDYLPRLSKTIEFLYLHYQNLHKIPRNFDDTWDPSYNLAEVDILVLPSGEIDTLLCAAPHLRTLGLHYSEIKVKGELYNSKRFGLKSFKVQDSNITSDVLRFLSFHCRSLNELSLEYTMVHGRLTTPGHQLIDMSYTRLDKLYLDNAAFIIQDIEFREENVALITRSIDDIPPKQDYDANVLPVVGGSPGKVHYTWFYTDYDYGMFYIPSQQHSDDDELISSHEETENITENTTVNEKTEEEYSDGKYKPISHYTKIKLGYASYLRICYADY